MKRFLILPSLAALTIVASVSIGDAQTADGCVETEATDPPRTVYQCPNGFLLEAEAATALELNTRSGQPEIVRVERNAVLFQLQPGTGPFQIRTPYAIASVRGTVYAVDETAERTSVFVVSGEVAVSRANGSDTVVLTPGEGADVAPGVSFAPVRWSAARAEALLARFGR
ncbi:MAG: FecR domain-containing protein [Hyphomicrobiales bacterium]